MSGYRPKTVLYYRGLLLSTCVLHIIPNAQVFCTGETSDDYVVNVERKKICVDVLDISQ